MDYAKVMVVEDHPMIRKMLAAMLRGMYSVVPAGSGEEAVALAREQQPDLILLDIDMPGMDGFRTLEVLKDGVVDKAVPVIFLTAREDSESREKGLEAGAVDYITKPYDRQELSIKVKNHLALYQARKEIEARNRSMAREMEMAAQLQSSLLPQQLPRSDRLCLAVSYRPLFTSGGDFYDVVELWDGSIGFVQVDVSGHGVASAMIGAMFKMAFQTFARETRSPARLLSTINDEMFRVLPDADFLTVFYGIINPVSLDLVFTNAGHPRPFLFRAEDGRIEELSSGGPLVGAFPSMEYEEDVRRLFPGDQVLVFTDGVTETRRAGTTEEFYGVDRLRRAFLRHLKQSPEEVLLGVLDDLDAFKGPARFEDDVTLLLASVT